MITETDDLAACFADVEKYKKSNTLTRSANVL